MFLDAADYAVGCTFMLMLLSYYHFTTVLLNILAISLWAQQTLICG